MEKIQLEVRKRSVLGKGNRVLRDAGRVPGVVYGRGEKSEAIEADQRELERVYHRAGGNKIVALKVGDGRVKNVLIQDVQLAPARGEIMHVDFHVVRMDEELKAEVPFHFVGESTAVYQQEGTLMKNLDAVEVECLPGDLPESIEVDISVLDDFEKSITLADLSLPNGVKFTEEDLSMLVVKVEPPRSEAEMAELDEAAEEELPEGVQEEEPTVVSEENEGDKDRREKK
ncbi:MAG TPA: 50S ribosomal protein L25 [Candidatus Saccharimonadia bacterium]|jgi:large subunit ribosomal protein L25